jgi:FdrA protein
MKRHVELRRGTYRDSVRLMQVSEVVRAVDGVSGVLVAMATEMNVELAAGMGFEVPAGATANDMFVAVAAGSGESLVAALAALEAQLAERPTAVSGATGVSPPRTVGSAVQRFGASIVLVSTPGRYAFLDAMDALDAGTQVMVFSDNVPVEQEILLKRTAAERGLLVLGPDCGTAVIDGVGLGFANVVRPGPVGIVAASGTGAQQVMCLLDAAGVGVAQCYGVGGRDLSAEVGGLSTVAVLDRLDADPEVALIVVLSKPPDEAVAAAVRSRVERSPKPVVFLPGVDLTATVESVLERLGSPVPQWQRWHPETPAAPRRGVLRGLFAGGTLCQEAAALADCPHEMVDFGADEYTLDRPHPMIDGSVRLAALDGATGVVLLDVVLGHGADPDPAASLAPAIAASSAAVVVSLIGTRDDPQGLDGQAAALASAGATVFVSNAQAARFAAGLVAGPAAGPAAGPGAGPVAS